MIAGTIHKKAPEQIELALLKYTASNAVLYGKFWNMGKHTRPTLQPSQ
jgi:hypothetical protein